MTRFDVIESLARAGLYSGSWNLDDDAYDALSVQFVVQAWAAWAESLPDELKEFRDIGGAKTVPVPRWIAEVWDCDNAARDLAVFLDRCAAVDAVKMVKARGNVAVGKFNFSLNANPATAHARLWFVDYAGILHVFDPRTGQLDGMSQGELLTVTSGESI